MSIILKRKNLKSTFLYSVIFNYSDLIMTCSPYNNGPDLTKHIAKKIGGVNGIKCTQKTTKIEYAFSSKNEQEIAIQKLRNFRNGIIAEKGFLENDLLTDFQIDDLPLATIGDALKEVLKVQVSKIGEMVEFEMHKFCHSNYNSGSCAFSISLKRKLVDNKLKDFDIVVDNVVLKCRSISN